MDIIPDRKKGLGAFRASPPSAVVLDLKLPGMSGRDVYREIKRNAPAVPVIVLNAASDVIDKVVLLELGADNYVTKAFSPRELLAWVRAALHRSAQPASREDIYRFGDLAVNFAKMKLTRADRPVPLTAHEFKLLKFLAQNEERIF